VDAAAFAAALPAAQHSEEPQPVGDPDDVEAWLASLDDDPATV